MKNSLPYQNPAKADSYLETSSQTIDGKTVHRQVVEVAVNYDECLSTYPDEVTEIHTYKKEGVTIEIWTIIYTDSTKEFISSHNIQRL